MNSSATGQTWPRQIDIPLGVIAEQRPGVTRWQKTVVLPQAVFIAGKEFSDAPREIYRDGPKFRYLAGYITLTLHRKETGDYITNLQSRQPLVFVGLKEGGGEGEFTWQPFLVTVAPYEAEGYMHGGDELVEGVDMPAELASVMMDFIDAHHQDEPFKKRKRSKYFDPHSTPFARPPGWRETDR